MRAPKILRHVLPLALLVSVGCSKSSSPPDLGPGGGPGQDAGPNGGTDGNTPGGPDGGPRPGQDAALADSGPQPCQHDQGGAMDRGCDPGQVCNLSMNPPQCVPGKQCTTDLDCNVCSDKRRMPNETCGHGWKLTAFCDDRHGNVCTRSRAPCEPCTEDKDCGRPDPVLAANNPSKCLDYGNGQTFCGRYCGLGGGCPKGFTCDAVTQQCRRGGMMGCDMDETICPAKAAGQMCAGADQICTGDPCPSGGFCATNDLPGALGLCVHYCTTDQDCAATPSTPTCSPSGSCIAGCTPGTCAGGKVCQVNGLCGTPCNSDMDCTTNYGANTYCNQPNRQPPDIFKPYRETNSCAPLGCERAVDCAGANMTCDRSMNPPACVVGCLKDMDCLAGQQCKSLNGGQPQMSYTHAECQALPMKANATERGVCCDPGCPSTPCGANMFCCGDPNTPYGNVNDCLTLTPTIATRAQAGDCFQMPVHPFCTPKCTPAFFSSNMMTQPTCNSGYMPGFDVDPNIMAGAFQEQEWCSQVDNPMPPAMPTFVCNVTCNEQQAMMGGSGGCPQGWPCRPTFYACLTNADCGGGGTFCVGSNTDPMHLRVGHCKCGMMGTTSTVTCSNMNVVTDTLLCMNQMTGGIGFCDMPQAVTHPRCVSSGQVNGDMWCAASYNCAVPHFPLNTFPQMCFQ